ncbi:MAG: hypothetical protein K6G56_03605 [Clostridiales bacterium]|nr:hypothetical protein [Clostridiales bacterium]
MTEKLYYEKPTLFSCEAKVLSCCEEGGAYRVTLDRTVIFPEGGGQPADRGTIGEVPVLDAREKDGVITHICSAPLEVGKSYEVTLDIPRRLDHTEQHTGEHILSGLASKLFSAKNVGFHMAEDYCTIDLDRFLTPEELTLLEAEANRAVRRDLPVTAETMDHEGLSHIEIRKKSDVRSDDIRVVFIGGGEVDSCTCCGTHCERTGEVGFIRIADSQKYKSGTRLWFSCGGRAVKEAALLSSMATGLARSFSTSREDLPAAVRKQSEELSQAKRELKSRTLGLCRMIAKSEKGPVCVLVMEDFSANDVKMLADCLLEENARIALVFGRKDGVTNYRAARAEGVSLPMGELIKAVNLMLSGKGGGGPAFAQGASKEEVTPEMLETIRNYTEKAHNGR